MKTLKPLTVENAPEKSKGILANIQKGFGFIPNLLGTMANSPSLLEGYVSMDAAWEKSTLPAVDRQLVLLTASVENSCSYCVAAHSTVLIGMMKVDKKVVESIRKRTATGDAKKDALVSLVRELVSERGHLSEATQKRFFDQGYDSIQLSEILLGVALKTISNYFDHINPVEIDAGFKAQA